MLRNKQLFLNSTLFIIMGAFTLSHSVAFGAMGLRAVEERLWSSKKEKEPALQTVFRGGRTYRTQKKAHKKFETLWDQHLAPHLWSHKKETNPSLKQAFRGGRTKRQEYNKTHTHKTIRNMSFAELKKRKDFLVQANDKIMAIKYVEKMIPLCDDKNIEERGLMMLELADLQFDCGNLKTAESLYKEFSALYPSHDKAEYSLYKEILSSFLAILDADRDQSKTKETVSLTDAFLGRPVFKTFDKDVATIKKQCLKRELDSEISVFNYYLNKGSFRASEQRLSKIEQNHSTKLPEAPTLINDLKLTLVQKKAEAFGMPIPQTLPAPHQIAQSKQTPENTRLDLAQQNQIAAAAKTAKEERPMADRF